MRQAQQDLDRVTAEAHRLAATDEATTRAWRKASGLLAHIERSLRERVGGTELVPFDGELPRLGKEPLPDQIAKLRRRVTQLKADIEATESAPSASSVAKERMRAQIDQLAARGEHRSCS